MCGWILMCGHVVNACGCVVIGQSVCVSCVIFDGF